MAAQRIGKLATDKAQTPPEWTRTFRCRVIKPDTDVTIRQIIAGKTQALQESVHGMAFSDRLRWVLREVDALTQAAADAGEDRTPVNRASVLRLTYTKTGCTQAADGSMVCYH